MYLPTTNNNNFIPSYDENPNSNNQVDLLEVNDSLPSAEDFRELKLKQLYEKLEGQGEWIKKLQDDFERMPSLKQTHRMNLLEPDPKKIPKEEIQVHLNFQKRWDEIDLSIMKFEQDLQEKLHLLNVLLQQQSQELSLLQKDIQELPQQSQTVSLKLNEQIQKVASFRMDKLA